MEGLPFVFIFSFLMFYVRGHCHGAIEITPPPSRVPPTSLPSTLPPLPQFSVFLFLYPAYLFFFAIFENIFFFSLFENISQNKGTYV